MIPIPRPESPDPALFDTPVKLLTSLRFASAESSVSADADQFRVFVLKSYGPGIPAAPKPVEI
jgi:hypothetical protein